MTPTRVPTLVAVAIAVGLGLWVVARYAYTMLPPLPWTAVATLVLVAVVELVLARSVHARIHRQHGAPLLEPLVIARYLVLGKATAYTAAVAAGAFGGLLAYLLGNLSSGTQTADAWVAGACLLAAVGLCIAALLLEHACRVPKTPDDEEEQPSEERRSP